MSDEINYRHTSTGATLYITIETGSSIWNGSSLGSLVVADWLDYATSLTEMPANSFRYIGSLPVIPVGVYLIRVYQQSGASPSINDQEIASSEITWNGSSVATPAVVNTAKSTYLEIINKVLKRITQSEVTTVSSIVGHAKIIAELINEAQNELWAETTNWYTLYTTRTFVTMPSTGTYDVASDWGRTIDLANLTTETILTEDVMRSFDMVDPASTTTGSPTNFAIQGSSYVLYPIPASSDTMRERYWKIPSRLSSDGDQSMLPLFCEAFIVNWALMSILEYLNKFEQADRLRVKLYGTQVNNKDSILYKCKTANKKIVDQMIRFDTTETRQSLQPPRFPSTYGVS